MIIQILLICFASIADALCDTIAFHGGGIFHADSFFNINKQGKFLPFTKYPLDGFHVSKSVMLICFIMLSKTHSPLPVLLNIVFLGVIYILVFNLFFNKLLK